MKIHQIRDVSGFQSILDIWSRSRNLDLVTLFRVLQHDHEIVGRGISLRKRSVHDSGRPQCAGERWSRVRHPPTIVSNILKIAIFEIWPGHRGQAGGSLRWSEGLAGKLRLGAR